MEKTKTTTPKPSLGFRYTDEQEAMIKTAMRESLAYMRTFGKGFTPTTIGIDRSRYFEAPIPLELIKP